METLSAADRKRLKGESPADPVRGRDGLLSSGSARINDPGVRGQNSRGKGQQPGARRKTCCLLMANSFYCTSRAALPGSEGPGKILVSSPSSLGKWLFLPFSTAWLIPAKRGGCSQAGKREDAERVERGKQSHHPTALGLPVLPRKKAGTIRISGMKGFPWRKADWRHQHLWL